MVLGGIYDFANAYGRGYGRILLVSVNGIREREKALSHPALALLPEEVKEEVFV